MFYEIAREGPPTKFEVMRLKGFEASGRRNNFLIQIFDTGTDFAFMLVMFDQAEAIQLPSGTWDLYKATVGDNCPGAPAFFGVDRDRVLGLAIASAVIIAVSMSYRLLMAIRQVYRGRKDIQDWSDWLWVIMGLMGTTIDPWNGALWLNELLVSARLDKTDEELFNNELVSNIFLILLEDFPQLIVQICYGVFAGQAERTSVAWFVAIFSTCMSLASQLHEVIYMLAFQRPKLLQVSPS